MEIVLLIVGLAVVLGIVFGFNQLNRSKNKPYYSGKSYYKSNSTDNSWMYIGTYSNYNSNDCSGTDGGSGDGSCGD